MSRNFYTFNIDEEIWRDNKYIRKIKSEKADFMDEMPAPVADMGEPNLAKEIIQDIKDVEIESIHGIDFDYDKIPGEWGTIICLEILEHLFNPLFFLENVKAALKKNGILYLSTPYRPKFLWTEHHYHEIDDERIRWLFERAGFEIEKEKKIRLYRGWKWHLKGIRPLIRLHTFTRIYKLRPAKN